MMGQQLLCVAFKAAIATYWCQKESCDLVLSPKFGDLASLGSVYCCCFSVCSQGEITVSQQILLTGEGQKNYSCYVGNNLKVITSFPFFLWEFSLEEKILFLFSFPLFISFSSFIFINGKRKGTVDSVENKKLCFSIETGKNRWQQVKMGGGILFKKALFSPEKVVLVGLPVIFMKCFW